jgi:hypothetical protein
MDEQTKDILYSINPKGWQSYLQCDKFDIIGCFTRDFFDMMGHYQLADQLDPLLYNKSNQKLIKMTKKLTEKLNDKKRKAKSKKNDSTVLVPKMCLIHRSDSSHMTNECQIMQEQAYQMKEAWKNVPLGERSHQKHEREQQKQKEKQELHEMIMKEVKQSMQDMFKQMHQHHHSDGDSNIDESHHVAAMEDIMVSECYNLSDLHQPPTKKTKTQHFAPITTASLGMHLGKSSIHKLRVLFDSGSSGSIIVAKFIKNQLRK